jgi:cytochrome c-type biogenesis protein CcmH/NrfF
MLLIGVVAVFVFFRRQRAAAALPPALSVEEEARLARLLGDQAAEEEGPEKA